MSVYGLAKCMAHKLNNAAFYKKEILQPTSEKLQYSYDQLVPGLDQLLGIGRREQVVRIWRLQTFAHYVPVYTATIIHWIVSEHAPANPPIGI
jgi:hypothetical protein